MSLTSSADNMCFNFSSKCVKLNIINNRYIINNFYFDSIHLLLNDYACEG